jgi:ParB/RepB/Spo0J family partition protein
MRDQNERRVGKHDEESSRKKLKFLAVDRILIPKDKDADLDSTLVSELAESFKLSGQLEPILVQRLPHREHGKRYVLVAGAHRLEALKITGARKADCLLVEGNETQFRLAALAENLCPKKPDGPPALGAAQRVL